MVQIRGDEEAKDATKRLSKDGWKDKELGKWADKERDELEKEPYPAEISGQRYVRTYKLKYGYRVDKPRKMWRRIANIASARHSGEYGGYVVGQRQAYMHAGRWYQALNIVEGHLPRLTDKIGKTGIKLFEAN